jgi:hypothetical protein
MDRSPTAARLALALAIAALVAGRGDPARAAGAEARCLRIKLDAIGRKEADELRCFAAAAARGRTPRLGRCILRATGRLNRTFFKAGECSGEADTCGCLADLCAVDVRVALPDRGPSRCEAVRLRATGRAALATMRCAAAAAATGAPVDPACVQKARAKHQTAFAKTAGCSGDAGAVQAIVADECVTGLGGDPAGGQVVGALCTSHACDAVD